MKKLIIITLLSITTLFSLYCEDNIKMKINGQDIKLILLIFDDFINVIKDKIFNDNKYKFLHNNYQNIENYNFIIRDDIENDFPMIVNKSNSPKDIIGIEVNLSTDLYSKYLAMKQVGTD